MNDLALYSPRWWQHPSGLWLHSSLQETPDLRDVPAELRPDLAPLAIERRSPSSREQIFTHVDEALLGLPLSSLDDAISLAAQVNREGGLLLLAGLAARLFSAGHHQEPQLAAARWFCGEDLVAEMFAPRMRENPALMAFSEQHVNMFLRLVLRFGPAGWDVTPEGHVALRRGVLAATNLTLQGASSDGDKWVGLIVRGGSYSATETPALYLARAQRMGELVDDARARTSRVYCDVNQWMIEDYGLDLREQMTIGLAFAAVTATFADGDAAGAFKVGVGAEEAERVIAAAGLGNKREAVIALLSASAADYAAAFQNCGDSLDHLMWDTRPFKSAPFLRLDDGRLILLSPRFMHSWLGEGVYYRGLRCAQTRERASGYTSFMGETYERYCVELVTNVHPRGVLSSAAVTGERPYRHKGGESMSPDLAVCVGPDLILIEVTNRHLLNAALIDGDRDAVLGEIDRGISTKAAQLSGRIDDLLAGHLSLPDLNVPGIERIWPIVVSAGLFLQTPLLWNHLDEVLADAFQQARVQPLTLLDPEDLEILCELVAGGSSMPQLLQRKTQPAYARSDFKHWLARDHHAPRAPRRAKPITEALDRAWEPLAAAAGLDMAA